MRKLAAFVLGAALSVAQSGCLIVLADDDLDFDDDVEVVKIDGEYYVKDKGTHRLKKVDVEESTTAKETTKEGGGS